MTTTTARPTRRPYTVVCRADDPEWLAHRRGGLGASEIASALGENPWQSPITLWGHKTGQLPEEELSGDAIEMGLLLEPIVARRFAQKAQRKVKRAGVLLRSDVYPWAQATPDYWVHSSELRAWLPLELKTTDWRGVKLWVDGVPLHIRLQVQQQILVTGAPTAYVAVLVDGRKLYWAEEPRDEALIQQIILGGSVFWQCVELGVMPPVIGTEEEAETLKELWPYSTGEQLTLPEDAIFWDRELRAVKDEIKALESSKTFCEDSIKAAMGPAEIGLLPDGSGAYSWKSGPRKGYTVADTTVRPLRRIGK